MSYLSDFGFLNVDIDIEDANLKPNLVNELKLSMIIVSENLDRVSLELVDSHDCPNDTLKRISQIFSELSERSRTELESGERIRISIGFSSPKNSASAYSIMGETFKNFSSKNFEFELAIYPPSL